MTRPAWAPSARTRVAAVIGTPVRHSLSPVIFNAGFRALDLDWAYLAFEVPAGGAPAALAGMRALSLAGLNVTMPHKDAVAAAVDELDESAALLGAVNCVAPIGDGRLVGHNTDGPGFVRALAVEAGVDASGRTVALLGAGGAARSIAVALARAGVTDLAVINRSAPAATRCVELVERATPGIGRVGTVGDVGRADLVVNATSVGMAGTPHAGALPCDPALLRAGQVVVDVVYHPLRTALLEAATAAGAIAVDGLGMLLHQAAIAFELWTGRDAPVDAMREAVASELAARVG